MQQRRQRADFGCSDARSFSGAKSPVAEPTFTYPGGPQCKITYRDNGNGTMSWTADVTIASELITHASDTSGNINRHDEQVIVGLNTFTAPVPLSQVTDIGGVLYVPDSSASTSYWPDGSIEVFSTPAEAQKRETYLQAFAGTLFGDGYDYLVGTYLLRIFDSQTPTQAHALEAKFLTITK